MQYVTSTHYFNTNRILTCKTTPRHLKYHSRAPASHRDSFYLLKAQFHLRLISFYLLLQIVRESEFPLIKNVSEEFYFKLLSQICHLE